MESTSAYTDKTFLGAIFSRAFIWFCIYVLILVLYILLGKAFHINGLDQSLPAWYRLAIESAWLLPSILVAGFLVYRDRLRLYRAVAYGSILVYLISLFIILPMLRADSYFLREEGYDFMHTYSLMIFPLCLCVRKTAKMKKVLWLILLVAFAYMVIRTAITTSILVSLISVMLVLFYRPGKGLRTAFTFALLAMILLLLNSFGAFAGILDSLMPYFEGTPVEYKLQDIRESMLRGYLTGDSLTVRMDLHKMSWAAFFQNPIIGSEGVGGHSKLLDLAGSAGLLAFVPYLMIIISVLRTYMRLAMSPESRAYLVISFLLSGIYLYTKGIFGTPGYLSMFVIVPSIIMSLDHKDQLNL